MKERTIYSNIAIPPHDKTARIRQPGEGPFYSPASPVAAQFAPIMISLLFIVMSIGANQFDAPLLQALPQRIAIIPLIGNQPFGSLPGATLTDAGYCNSIQRLFEERNLTRGRSLQVVPQRNSLAVNHHHPLRAFPPLGVPDAGAPFFAGAKLPSTKASLQSNCLFSSSWVRKALHAVTQTSSSSQSFNLLQHVEGLGYSFGKSAQGAPVRSIQSIPSKTLRLSAQGRPPFVPGSSCGNNGSIFFHCSSVNRHLTFFFLFLAIGAHLLVMTKFTYCYVHRQHESAQIIGL